MKIGKKLKKNNVAVDVVSFGDTAANQALLEARTASLVYTLGLSFRRKLTMQLNGSCVERVRGPF